MKSKKRPPTLSQLVTAARREGVTVTQAKAAYDAAPQFLLAERPPKRDPRNGKLDPNTTYCLASNRTIGDLERELKQAQTGWRLPKRGDRLKVVKEPPKEINSIIRLGDIITTEFVGGYTLNKDGIKNWIETTVPAVAYLETPNSGFMFVPLDCLEPA